MIKKRILVFGATGEIGGRVARGCVDAGHHVTGVTRGANARHQVDLAGAELLVADKGAPRCYESVLAGREFDVVIDSVPTTEHVKLAHQYFRGRIEHYLTCSSTGTYVPLRYFPADESHPWREKTACNFYAQSQRDAFVLDLWREHRFPCTVLRPTNIIGPGRVPLELWGGRNLRYFQLMQKHQPVEIPVNGNILLQSASSDDLATAFVNAVPKGAEIDGETFIISSKKAITLDRYFEVACQCLKSNARPEILSIAQILEKRGQEASFDGLRFLVEHMCFDISKAQTMLDYAPQYTPEQGLERALAWCFDAGVLT